MRALARQCAHLAATAGRLALSGPSPSALDTLTGRTLGEFVLRDRIGEGGFGAVYRAIQPLLEREAVVKVLHTQLRSARAGTERFLREAKLASRLDHPYAAHIYAFGAEPDGVLWIAMELVRGTPLDQLMRAQGPLELERFVPLLDRICEVVHTAHEQGIVHRDIKPANVMVLSRAGRLLPKLLDFGIAKAMVASSAGSLDERPATPLPDTPVDEAALADTEAPVALTQRGSIMGSPHYMAPEQWLDATAVDARADLYALGVLAYEALTGRPPFRGESLRAIAAAHARGTVPALGGRFPPALDEVLRRALAKRPEDRYTSALELAAAFRAASGLAPEQVKLPQLEPALRDELLASAPQPIAEAVAALEAGRNAHQARDALWRLVRTVVRVIALYALACRSRVGSGGDGDTRTATELLRTLHRRPLTDGEWLTLARELCRPFAGRMDAFPLPELVGFFFGDEETATAGELEALLEVRRAHEDQALDEDALLDLLARGLERLPRLWRGLAFLADYPLVVPVSATVGERWMGVRRSQRASTAIAGRGCAPGEPTLLDAAGHPLLSLHPICQVAAPVPGAPLELFLFEGPGKRGARLLAQPLAFEIGDDALWDWYRAQLGQSLDDRDSHSGGGRAPYRGLSAFSPDDAGMFFGRERATEAFLNRLQMQSLLAVVGHSGAGKSSFVQAGVIPGLPAGWRALTVRPGPAPLATLAARLEAGGVAGVDRAALARDVAALGAALRADAARRGPIVLVVDQLEELFTLCLDAAEQRQYADALAHAAGAAEDPVRVIFTLRDDFLARAGALPSLRDRITQGLQLLTTPGADDLVRILVEPARRAGYEFEDAELPIEMVREVVDQPGALPLLSFCAATLWELRDRHFRQLTRKAFRALGGVGGALAKHAEETLEAMRSEERRLAREAFRHLVTAEGTRAVLSRGELTQVLGAGAPADAVIERLVTARLLVTSEGERGEDRVEIVHEALLAAWPRLVEWRREDAEGARLRDQLRAAARQWEDRGRPRGLLWRDDALAEYRRWRARAPGALTASEEAFAARSLADAARSRRLRRGLVAGSFVVLTAGVVVLTTMNARTDEQRRAAVAARADAERSSREAQDNARRVEAAMTAQYEEQGRQALLAGRVPEALVYLSEAYGRGADSPALRFMLGQAVGPHAALERTLTGHTGKVQGAELSPDGRWLATAGEDHTVRLWSASDGTPRRVFTGHAAELLGVHISPDGARLVSFGLEAEARLWDPTRDAPVATLGGHAGLVQDAQFTPDGRRVVTVDVAGTGRCWDARDGRLLFTLSGHRGRLLTVAVSPDGARIVTGGEGESGGEARLWDGASGRPVAVMRGQPGQVVASAFSPDGATVVTGAGDGSAALWDGRTGALRMRLPGHVGLIRRVGFSPDGARLFTAGGDGTVRLWDPVSGRLLALLDPGGGAIDAAAFDRRGERIATGDIHGAIVLWDAHSGARIARLHGHSSAVSDLEFAPDGATLWSASWDGTARRWDARRSERLARLTGDGDELITAAVFDARGERIATASERGWVAIWDAATGRQLARFRAHDSVIYDVAFSPDGTRLATASDDHGARVWDAASGGLVTTCAGHTGAVFSVAFDAAGTRLLTGSDDRTAAIWDARSGAQTLRLLEIEAVMSARWSGREDVVLTATWSHAAHAWDARDGRLLTTFAGPAGGVTAVAESPDGERVLTTHMDGSAIVWSAAGEKLGMVRHLGFVFSGVFSPDGELILTISADGTAALWDAKRFQLLARYDARSKDFSRGAFDPRGERFVVAEAGQASVWQLARYRDMPERLAALTRCWVPLRIDQATLVPADVKCTE